MNNKKIKAYFDETLENIVLIKEYYAKKQNYVDAAKLRDIEKILKSID